MFDHHLHDEPDWQSDYIDPSSGEESTSEVETLRPLTKEEVEESIRRNKVSRAYTQLTTEYRAMYKAPRYLDMAIHVTSTLGCIGFLALIILLFLKLWIPLLVGILFVIICYVVYQTAESKRIKQREAYFSKFQSYFDANKDRFGL